MKKVLYSFIAIGLLFTNVYVVNARIQIEQDCFDGVCIEHYDELPADEGNDDAISTYTKVVCGDIEIAYAIPQMVRTIIIILQIATPIIIIILGSVDLLKAVMAQKEDEIKKCQQIFTRRLIVGSLVFLVFVLTELVIGLVAPKNDNQNMWNCVDCFVNGKCANVIK